jgi:putative transposase
VKLWLSLKEIADLLGIRKQSANVKVKGYPYVITRGGHGGSHYIYDIRTLPEDIQAAYARSFGLSLEALQERFNKPKEKLLKGEKSLFKDLDRCSESELETARLRSRIVHKFAEAKSDGIGLVKFCELYNAGLILPKVREQLSKLEAHTLTKSRLYAYIKLYDSYGLSGLAPQYHARGGAGASLPREIIERIEWLYLDSAKPSVARVWRDIAQYAEPLGVTASLPTVRRVINNILPAVQAYFRKGENYFNSHYQAYIERDYTQFRPMEVIVGDYVTLDFLVRVDGHLWRPKLCAFMDMKTRAVVGWSLQLTANSTGVVLALKMCFERYGLPGTIYFDNGKEFKNYQLCGNEWKIRRSSVDAEDVGRDVGIVVEAGVNISFCQPYHGQSKPIERFWRTLYNEFDKGFLTYYGSNTADRPDEIKLYYHNVKGIKKRDINEVVDFAAVERLLENHLRYYNECWKHTGNGMNGRTPLEAWETYADWRKKEIPAEIAKYLWAFRYQKTVQRNGVKHDGAWYFPTSEENVAYVGEKVEIRVPLDKRGVVHVFSLPERKFLFDAYLAEFEGNVEKDIEKVDAMRKGKKEILENYRKRKAEFDKGEYRTPAEIYATENPPEAELQVVGGASLKQAERPVKKAGKQLISLFLK